MIVRRSREHTVNLGNYENVKVGAVVEFSEEDMKGLRLAGDSPAAEADKILDELLKTDLDEALANVMPGDSSHLESWKKD